MILKKSGITYLSGLRTIVLFPVDCDFAFKHIGRAMTSIAEATNSLAPEQFGSRKRHKAIDLVVSKVITFDIMQQMKRSGAICSNNAKSCYDLIGHTQAAVSMQRVGVPKSVIKCLFSTLQNVIHRVRTGYGDSSASYGGDVWLIPIHGIEQGNGAGPAIWAVVSTPLLNALRKKGFGFELISPLSSQYHKFVGYAFVDDTDIILSALCNDDQQVINKLQEAVDLWEHWLKTTCGAIVPEKTAWWLVSFWWSGGEWRYALIDDFPSNLYVDNISGERKKIRRLESHQAYKTLGVFIAPDGNSTDHFNKLLTLAMSWADAMRTGFIRREEAWLAVNSTILRSLAYSLPALRLSRQQWDCILSPILQYCLPAMGVCRYFPRKLVFASSSHFGLGFKHLHTVQEIAHIKDIIWHNFSDTLTGTLYKTSFELMLLECGVGTDILLIPDWSIQLSIQSLILDTIQFLRSHNINLYHNVTFTPQRENDALIMQQLGALDLSLMEIKACNHCRMYLRVLYLSDIVSGDGLTILDSPWNGIRDESFHRETWPNFGNPPRTMWNVWRQALKLRF
jgi:hypothetical protein